jgi:threonine/homoserine/homoserine lactone efflux protein
MSLDLFAAFVAATTVLMLIPGPNVALITAGAVAHGARHGLVTVAGTCAAMAVQLALVGLGMAGVLGLAGQGFAILRWAGVIYLVWLGIAAWRTPPADLNATPPPPGSLGRIFLRGFLVSLTNPKTLIFYAAFLPQFVPPSDPPGRLWLLAATFLALAAMIDSGWALGAARLRPLLSRHARLRGRVTGAILIAAGAGLAAARRGS